MPIYEQPTRVLMQEFARSELTPQRIFEKSLAVRWFAQHYPKIKSTTVQMHVEAMSVNSTLRQHHPRIRPGSGHDLFYKVGPGRFRLWDEKTDPAPRYGGQPPEPNDSEAELADISEEKESAGDALSSEFAAERDLRNYLEKNLGALEPGLRIYDDEGISGIEFPAGGRRIDILAVGADDAFVVIELKVSRGYDRVIGQIMRYMAWIKTNLAEGKAVRGIIVASEISEDLKLATSMLQGVRLVEYELSFRLKAVD